jgi:hypothetical protein
MEFQRDWLKNTAEERGSRLVGVNNCRFKEGSSVMIRDLFSYLNPDKDLECNDSRSSAL